MNKNYATSQDERYTAAYGHNRRDGFFIAVYDNEAIPLYEPIVDKIESFDGIDGIDMFVIAHRYGAGDEVYAWLDVYQPEWAARWYG